MTIEELNASMVIGVSRTDLLVAGTYYHFVNEAQRAICAMRSFQWMKTEATLNLTAGLSSVSLPLDFKEFTKSKSPVYLSQTGVAYPVELWTLEKHRRRNVSILSTQVVAHLDDTTDPPSLAFMSAFDADTVFVVRYYKFLADLTTGSNTLTTRFPFMVLHKAKALAFATVNDPMAQDFEQLFYLEFKRAAAADATAQLAGIDLHM